VALDSRLRGNERETGDPLTGRRILFALIVLASMVGLIWLLAFALSAGGFGVVDFILVVMFAVTLPWSVIGFWNATIGLLLMRFSRDPVAAVTPVSARVRGDEPITSRTAVLWCVRNEDTERVIRNIEPMMEGLVAAGVAQQFHVFILSDTNYPEIAEVEEPRFAALAAKWQGRIGLTYRRRTENTAFKQGNIGDFFKRWGADYEFAYVLDADSFQTAESILRMVRIMQIDPKLGILQSLVVGMPSTSAFARIFQFGMRLGMRSYTLGSAWWQGDCGPYWGHNAIIRVAPFMAHCHIPMRPDGTYNLSHDQLEALLMRRAGYEVRVLPEEGASWEENPPTLTEFIRRDLRWAQGNMQYAPYLVLPGVQLISRYQIAFAMLMFIGSPAWIGLLVLGTLAIAAAGTPSDFIRTDAGTALFVIILIMWFAPKIATVIDVVSRPELRRAFGGPLRFIASVITETLFFLMLSPIMWFGHTMFLTGLLLGRKIGWGGQARDDHSVPWADAARQLWPHTLLGWSCIVVLAFTVPSAIPYALFIAAGPALSIPLAVITSWPAVGRALMRVGLGALPEENAPPAPLRALALPAIEAAAALRAA
jgi:membrane glycosyltransferase